MRRYQHSSDFAAEMEDDRILRPLPRRPESQSRSFLTTDTSSFPRSSSPGSPTSPLGSATSMASSNSLLARPTAGLGQKTRSVLNLTSSTLFGIYSPEGRDNYDPQSLEASRSGLTPSGTGAQTPVRSASGERGSLSRNSSTFFMTATTADLAREAQKKRQRLESEGAESAGAENKTQKVRPRSLSHDHRSKSWSRDAFGLLLRTAALFVIGLAYGVLVTELQDRRGLASVKVEGIDTKSELYLFFWGVSGVLLGNALPYVDQLLGRQNKQETEERAGGRRPGEGKESYEIRRSEVALVKDDDADARTSLGADWNPIVRSIGAFVGVAFAIRRLPWQSTLQLSLTLATANPCIWYLIDRTRSGFYLASVVGFAGAAIVFTVHPEVVPQPSRLNPAAASPLLSTQPDTNASFLASRTGATFGGLGLSYESIGVATWISSVLFCSAVCFGNIGRRLQQRQREETYLI